MCISNNLKNRCFLNQLVNTQIKGVIPGIELKNGKLCINHNFFKCCQGTSQIFDDKTNTTYICDLNWRFMEVERLFKLYHLIWRDKFRLIPEELNQDYDDQRLKVINNFFVNFNGSQQKAMIFKTNLCMSPSKMWPLALSSVWKHGFKSIFICFGKHKFYEQISVQLQTPSIMSQRKVAIFVGNIDKLYDSKLSLELDNIISYAYESNFYLFLEFIDYSKKIQEPKLMPKLSKFFRDKMNILQNKSNLDFMFSSSISKLREICINFDTLC